MKVSKLLAFAAIGTIIGLLFTTKKGRRLRSNIADTAGTLAGKMKKKSDVLSDDRKVLSEYIA